MAQVAERLGTWPSTITRWCESGKLPAIPKCYGAKTSYLIAPTTIEMLLQQKKEAQAVKQAKKSKAAQKPHPEHIAAWVQAMNRGTLTGKVYSKRTVEDYQEYTEAFFKRHKTLSEKTLELELSQIPSEKFAKREKVYKSLLCFGKWLIRQGALDEAFLQEIKPLFPKRHLPPKRHTVTAEEVEKLIKACKTLFNETLITVLANTGLRASELCALKLEDINMEKRILTVKLGKGNKTRRVGLNNAAYEVLSRYLAERKAEKPEDALFLNLLGKPMDATGLLMRVRAIGKAAGVKVSPHALRRAFVTINALKGHSLVYLQRACGHADITTTRSYCRETEDEVLAAMQNW